jgi:hypothetical protein
MKTPSRSLHEWRGSIDTGSLPGDPGARSNVPPATPLVKVLEVGAEV